MECIELGATMTTAFQDNAFQNDAFQITAAAGITGAGAATFDAMTGSATGAVAISGAGSVTLGAMTGSAAGAVSITATGAVTLDSMTATGTGTVAITAAGSATFDAMTGASTATVSITGAGINSVTGTYPNFTITGTEVDGSTTNEIQTYSHGGTTSYTNTLSSGGGSFTLQAGTGITLSHTAGTVTITASGSGDILQNGNTFGAGVVIGTNDNFTTALETNGVTRMSISSGASTGGDVTFTGVTANTTTVQNRIIVQTNSSGVAASGIGSGVLFQAETSTTDNQDQVLLSSIWTTATHASRTSALVYADVNNAGALTERFRFTPVSMTTAVAYTIGNSGSTVTIGGSTGFVTVSSQATSPAAIQINTNNATVGGTTVGGSNGYVGATLNKQKLKIGTDSYTVATGTGTLTGLLINDTYNLTGTASGVQKGIHVNPTLTSLTAATYRGLFLEYDNANAFGVYQAGELTQNYFEGKIKVSRTTGGTGANNAFLNLSAGAIAGDVDMIRSTGNISNEMINITANARNVGNSGNVRIEAQVGGTLAGDPYFAVVIPGGSSTVFGNDNTDADKFKITPGGTSPGSTANKGLIITQDAAPLVGINTDVPAHALDVAGRARASTGFIGKGFLWQAGNITFNTGAGTGPTLNSITGTDNGFEITFTTGTTPAADGVIFTGTYPNAWGGAGWSNAVLCAANKTTANEITKFYTTNTNSNSFQLQANGSLTASTAYKLRFAIWSLSN